MEVLTLDQVKRDLAAGFLDPMAARAKPYKLSGETVLGL